MAHSHTKTQLAALGFRDPDKKEPRHDWACQYLAQPPVFFKMIVAMAHAVDPEPLGFNAEKFGFTSNLEFMLTKGLGKYKTTLGYLDMFPRLRIIGTLDDKPVDLQWDLIVEVKIQPVPIGDVLRQMALYREFASAKPLRQNDDGSPHPETPLVTKFIKGGVSHALLVTDFDLDATDVQTLQKARIGHVRLGQGFEDYVTARKAAPPAVSISI